jgi:hypothetical protein
MAKPSQLKSIAKKYVVEFLQCRADFDYFVKKYIYLELPGKDILLSPYGKQIELVDLIEAFKYVLVLKSRQIGISTIIQAYAAWLAVFYNNVVIGIISKDGAEATDFARVIRGMVEKLPDWMKPLGGLLGRGFAKRTERSFILTNGSKVYASPVNPNAPDKTLRGKAITLLVIDEAAFVNHLSLAWTSIVPSLSTNQMQARNKGIPYGTIVLSTPNKTVGIGQWYYQRYMKAISGNDIFKPFVIHWKMIPELSDDPSWYQTQCALFDNDAKKIAQELELKFLPTEGSFFEAETVEKMQDACVKPIEKIQLFNGQIWKFTEAIPGRYYMIGVDTSPEHGIDKSAITIWDYETLEQVWEFQGKCKVLDFVKVVKVAAASYPGLIVVESNSYGNQVVEHINASEYGHMLYKEKRGKNTFVPGLSTNIKTRPLIIDALYSYMTEFPECVKSERLALELTGLVSKTSGKVEADTGCSDDIALSAAICMYVRKYDPPLLVNFESSALSIDMRDVIDMNTGSPIIDFTNKDIIQHVRDKYNEHTGFVDTLEFFRE